MTDAGSPGDRGADADDRFQALMGELGEAKARYDQVVRDVSVAEQPPGAFRIAADRYEAWRHASDRLRSADAAVLEFLAASVAPAEPTQ